jgi:DNA-binding IclR family transcriptional regulator
VGIAGPLDRIQPRSDEIAALLREAAHAISSRLQLGGN